MIHSLISSVAIGALMLAGSAISAENIQVDQPHDWWRYDISHHGKHGVGGVELGFAAYEGAALVTDSRPWRYADAVITGAVVGLGYEAYMGRDGKSYLDCVDAAWCTAGSLVGAALADATNQIVSIGLTKGGASTTIAFRF